VTSSSSSNPVLVTSNLTELEAQLAELQDKVMAERARVKTDALAAIRGLLENGTLNGGDLLSLLPAGAAAPKRERPPRNNKKPPKYKDPDSGSTWTGQGAEPNWIKGQDREKFLIDARAVP
jgi:DNA-binding protein H-NS